MIGAPDPIKAAVAGLGLDHIKAVFAGCGLIHIKAAVAAAGYAASGFLFFRRADGIRRADGRESMPDIDLSEARIAVLVDRFYDKVRVDPLLGPVFNAAVDDWDAHKRLLTSFWCTVALRARSYRGNPLAKHRPLPIEVAHFERWLSLWHETTHEVLDETAAELLASYAGRIALGLSAGIGLDERPRAAIRASL